jgi:nitrite reductase/ring-hydroxylating ferredoxin subunit
LDSTPTGARSSRRIPTARYTLPAWKALEDERLWPRVWQIACTLDCVPNPGDYWEYAIADLSILVVRGHDGQLRAFHNACPHRGNLLKSGSGTGLDSIRCSYHHWCFDLRGRLASISPEDGRVERAPLSTDSQPGRQASRLDLAPARVDTWAGFVFVNPDPSAEPLSTYLEGLPAELAWVGMEQFSCDAFMTVPVACNWKVVIDAFIETYHLHAVHPQMLAIADDVHTPITLYDKHTKFVQPYGVSSPRRAGSVSNQELWESFVGNLGHRMGIPFADAGEPGPHPPLSEGRTMRDVLVERIRAHLSGLGGIYADLDDHHVIDDFHYHLFPNAVLNVFAGWFGLIRARPGATADTCLLDMWNFDLRPEASPDAHPRPVARVLSPEEVRALGPVLLQDLDLMPRVQRGLNQRGLTHFQLTRSEARIGRMHEILDRYLDPPKGLALDADRA